MPRDVPMTFAARGLSDAVDATNAFPGAMQSLANLIPSADTPGLWVPRPASQQLTAFGGFTNPAGVTALKIVGDIAYGMITSGAFPGKDQPFAYDLVAGTYKTITGMLAANLPATQATSGDWTPPCIDVVGSRIVFTHPGFPGGATKFGWLDISSFTSNTITGTTHTSALIDSLSSNPINAGWAPGMVIAGAGIVAGTTIVSMTATSVLLSQATSSGGAGVGLTVTGGTAASPQWGAGDTNTNALAAVPVSVCQFSGRAYYAVGASVVLSDAGNATQVTNATQALTFRNGVAVTALAPLALASPISGGMVQGLIAFQGIAAIQQITGDPTTSNLAANALPVATGTRAPNAICPTSMGLAFIAPDGLRIIDQSATVSDPLGLYGQGVAVPFMRALYPSRMCAAFTQGVLRVSVQNAGKAGNPTEEYWFTFTTKQWSGPHTFPAALIQPWQGTSNTFVLAAIGIDAKLWQSDPVATSTSSYTENGAALSWTWQPCLLPDNRDGVANCMVEATLGMALPGQIGQVTVQALNEIGTVLDTVTVSGSGSVPTVWGSFTWGSALWTGFTTSFTQYQLPWTRPVTFKQASLKVTASSVAGTAIGNLYMRTQRLGYMLKGVAA